MVHENSNFSLIRLNLTEAVVPESLGNRAIGIDTDISKAVSNLCAEFRNH
ncbi:MAG: hypothetical protein HDT30_03580 [Clostridiales bacterium]|nr:hypothetical protein [Clostridiales bacterium]